MTRTIKLFSVLFLCFLLTGLLSVEEVYAAETQIIIDGAAYDADKMYKNGVETDEWWLHEDGWVYNGTGSTKTLNLRNYNGGAIDLSGTETWVYFYGDCVITGTDGEPGMTGGTWLYIRGNDNSSDTEPRTLTVTGGAGAPAVEADQFSLLTASYSPCHFVGGEGAPAVRVTLYELDGHCEFISGSADVPAVEGAPNIYLMSETLYYAGDDKDSAVLLNSREDYDDEPYLRTDCRQVTLTFDCTGGKLFGRGSYPMPRCYNETLWFDETHMPVRPGYFFLGWSTDPAGEEMIADYTADPHSANLSITEDTTLYAQWHKKTGDVTILVSPGFFQESILFDLPAEGDTFLPPDLGVEDGETAFQIGWHPLGGSGSLLPPHHALYKDDFFDHAVLRVSTGSERPMLLEDYNGLRAEGSHYDLSSWTSAETVSLRTVCSDTGELFDSWNTARDGSGTVYRPGDPYNFVEGETLVLYAQWKAPITYTTTVANETVYLPKETFYPQYNAEEGTPRGVNVLWRTADGRLYENGAVTDLPAGTTLTACVYDFYEDEFTVLMGNGDDRNSVSLSPMYSTDEVCGPSGFEPLVLSRTGYTFTGWNTAPDGSGTDYPTDDPDAPTPAILYAQWEKNVPKPEVPADMRALAQEDGDVTILFAVYDADGKLLRTEAVDPDTRYIPQGTLPEAELTYQFLCLDEDFAPLLTGERGALDNR